jgi:hypothetical protein
VKAMTHEALKLKKYWFREDDLLEPIDWKYVDSLAKRVRLGLELYMEGSLARHNSPSNPRSSHAK